MVADGRRIYMEIYAEIAMSILDELHTERRAYHSEYVLLADAINRLAAYEETGLEPEAVEHLKLASMGKAIAEIKEFEGVPIDRLRELAQAEKEGRLVVLEHAAKKGEKKPPCFYNDMGQEFCLGLARGECDDEPIDRCKECWYCESTREAAEAALEEREAEHDR